MLRINKPERELNLTENSPSWIHQLKNEGYAVVPNVLASWECDDIIDQTWEWLAAFRTGIQRNDPSSWTNDHWPINYLGTIQGYRIGHEWFVWQARTNSNVIGVFEEIWGTRELLTSFDGMCIVRPTEMVKDVNCTPDFHTDQGPRKEGFHCVQGTLNLEEAAIEDAVLACYPGSHKLHAELFQRFNYNTSSDFIVISKEGLQWMERVKGLVPTRIPAPKGSFIIFDSRLIQSIVPAKAPRKIPRWSYTLHICMTPRAWADETTLHARVSAFKSQRMTTHWPHDVCLFPEDPEFPMLPEFELGDVGEKLVGIKDYNEFEDVGPPPDDFREMTIIPHRDDIFTEKKPYLRRNIVQGAYQDLDHYLDVQFRLLREDFLRPLREGIINLVNHGIDQKQGLFKDIRIYRNVKILYPVCSNSGLRHHIQFDNSRLKRVKWENSKRLIFGSLLCLSKDHFQTFVFATVADRNPKELAYGKVTVQFMDLTIDLQDFSSKNAYEMVETTAYFEAYNPILEGIQQTEDNDLPFQRYLIECNKDIQAPQYLRRNRFELAAPSFDFSSILMEDASSNATARLESQLRHLSLHGSIAHRREPQFKNVPVLDVRYWPSKEQLGLDKSQYEALKIALTKEVAVIQGPPGTGKTFLGLKIAKLLLNNTRTWIHGEQTLVGTRREVNQTPILVICFTNHALDQFLEGIYDFYGENENKIVRIGGRSKSEKLKDCNLKAIKDKGKKRAPRYVGRSIAEVHSRLEGVKRKLEISSNVIRKCWQNILYERTLQRTGVVQSHHFSSLMEPFTTFGGGQPEQGSVVLKWLNLVAGDEWTQQEEVVLFGENTEISFNGMEMASRAALALANVDFSLCVKIKTSQAGNIVSNLPENRRWKNESKALCVDPTGVVRFISGENIVCESFSRVNDNKWHEIAVVYSNEDESLALYIDKRIESLLNFHLPEESQQYEMKIGVAPLYSGHGIQNFVGSMKKLVYYPSTKYNDMVRGDGKSIVKVKWPGMVRNCDDHLIVGGGPENCLFTASSH